MFCAGDKALEINALHAGDEDFSAGDEHVENMHSSFSHTQLATSDSKKILCRDVGYSRSYLPPNPTLSH